MDTNQKAPEIINAASEKHRAQMERLAAFCRVDTVEYKDLGNGEVYTLKRGSETLILSALGNKVDGGFLCVK